MAKVKVGFQADQKQADTHFEQRMDDILVQIQSILSSLEDSFYAKIGKLEN